MRKISEDLHWTVADALGQALVAGVYITGATFATVESISDPFSRPASVTFTTARLTRSTDAEATRHTLQHSPSLGSHNTARIGQHRLKRFLIYRNRLWHSSSFGIVELLTSLRLPMIVTLQCYC